jgi:hypothetical protein
MHEIGRYTYILNTRKIIWLIKSQLGGYEWMIRALYDAFKLYIKIHGETFCCLTFLIL